MSSYFFGSWSGHATAKWIRRAEQIAKRHDASCVPYHPDHEAHRGWFETHNRGAPFDQAVAKAVMADLEAENLWPPSIR